MSISLIAGMQGEDVVPTPPAVLGSWKEIAQFLGKGVRTVQRWEHELKLPVHRPSNANKGVVIAFPQELENWARHQVNSGNPDLRQEQLRRMHVASALLVERTEALRKNLERIAAQCLKAQTWATRNNRKDAAYNGNGVTGVRESANAARNSGGDGE